MSASAGTKGTLTRHLHLDIHQREERLPQVFRRLLHGLQLSGDDLPEDGPRGVQFVDRICESGRFHFAASKCRYYGGLVRSGEMDRAHALNIVRKIMLEDFSIDLP